MVGAGTDRTRPRLSGGPAVILVRPQGLAVNIGMCARAMANFGLDDLRPGRAPREGWPRVGEYRDVAYAAAAGAAYLLDAARVFDSVGAAVADLNFLYAATTARERDQVKRGGDARRRQWRASDIAGTRSAACCSAARAAKRRSTRSPAQRGDRHLSINWPPPLAQPRRGGAGWSAMKWFKATMATRRRRPQSPAPSRRRRTREMTLACFEFFEGKLDEAGFFRPAPKKPGMRRNLRNMFHRMAMTQQDVRTFWGAIVRPGRGPARGGGTRKRARQKN